MAQKKISELPLGEITSNTMGIGVTNGVTQQVPLGDMLRKWDLLNEGDWGEEYAMAGDTTFNACAISLKIASLENMLNGVEQLLSEL